MDENSELNEKEIFSISYSVHHSKMLVDEELILNMYDYKKFIN